MIDILIPTLGRAEALCPLVDNIAAVTSGAYWIWFVCDQDDQDSQEVAKGLGPARRVMPMVHDGSYPEKTNWAFAQSEGGNTLNPLVLPTADDVRFHDGWLEAVEATFKDPDVQVIGTDDLSPATANREHATMPVLRRSYVKGEGSVWGEIGTIFHEGYRHNFCETETWQLALHRGVTAWAEGAIIEHLHPAWGKRAEDATDEKGNKQGWEADEALFRSRREQWLRS